MSLPHDEVIATIFWEEDKRVEENPNSQLMSGNPVPQRPGSRADHYTGNPPTRLRSYNSLRSGRKRCFGWMLRNHSSAVSGCGRDILSKDATDHLHTQVGRKKEREESPKLSNVEYEQTYQGLLWLLYK